MPTRIGTDGLGAAQTADSCDCWCDAVTLFLPRLHKLDEESVGVSGTDHTGGVKGREGFGKQLHPVPLQFLDGLLNHPRREG